MFGKVRKFVSDKSGVTAIEYGLIAAMVGVAIIGGVTLLGQSLDSMFTNVSTELDSKTSGFGGTGGGTGTGGTGTGGTGTGGTGTGGTGTGGTGTP